MKLRPSSGRELDQAAVRRMGQAFLAATPYGPLLGAGVDDIDRLIGIVGAFGDNGLLLLACDDDDEPFGMIALVALENPLNGKPMADEIVWWVDADHRGAMRAGPALLDAAEQWARRKSLYLLKMVAPHGSAVGRYYLHRGFQPVETSYAKVL